MKNENLGRYIEGVREDFGQIKDAASGFIGRRAAIGALTLATLAGVNGVSENAVFDAIKAAGIKGVEASGGILNKEPDAGKFSPENKGRIIGRVNGQNLYEYSVGVSGRTLLAEQINKLNLVAATEIPAGVTYNESEKFGNWDWDPRGYEGAQAFLQVVDEKNYTTFTGRSIWMGFGVRRVYLTNTDPRWTNVLVLMADTRTEGVEVGRAKSTYLERHTYVTLSRDQSVKLREATQVGRREAELTRAAENCGELGGCEMVNLIVSKVRREGPELYFTEVHRELLELKR